MAQLIFTEYRRDLIAKTFFDLLKVAFAASFASRFFLEFGGWMRFGVIAAMLCLGLLGFLICPGKSPKGGS